MYCFFGNELIELAIQIHKYMLSWMSNSRKPFVFLSPFMGNHIEVKAVWKHYWKAFEINNNSAVLPLSLMKYKTEVYLLSLKPFAVWTQKCEKIILGRGRRRRSFVCDDICATVVDHVLLCGQYLIEVSLSGKSGNRGGLWEHYFGVLPEVY